MSKNIVNCLYEATTKKILIFAVFIKKVPINKNSFILNDLSLRTNLLSRSGCNAREKSFFFIQIQWSSFSQT